MDSDFAPCPAWLVKRLVQTGGSMSFHQFMDLALNDPINGAYSSGRLKIGKRGDFATSPSISSDFAELLATQLVDWFSQLDKINQSQSLLTLVEVGPGEGDDLLRVLVRPVDRALGGA